MNCAAAGRHGAQVERPSGGSLPTQRTPEGTIRKCAGSEAGITVDLPSEPQNVALFGPMAIPGIISLSRLNFR